MKHPAEQFYLYSGHSTNTEKNEATFNTLKTFTNLTQGSLSNYFKNMYEIILVIAKNHAKNMPCLERFVKFQAKSYLSRQHKKRKKEKKFFHTIKQNIQKILASKYL